MFIGSSAVGNLMITILALNTSIKISTYAIILFCLSITLGVSVHNFVTQVGHLPQILSIFMGLFPVQIQENRTLDFLGAFLIIKFQIILGFGSSRNICFGFKPRLLLRNLGLRTSSFETLWMQLFIFLRDKYNTKQDFG